MLALVAARELGLDVERAVVSALIHEMCEAIVGDIIPADGVPADEKLRLEEEAAEKVLSEVDDSGELLELWRDFEYGRTPEGCLVKGLDKVEMALQASEYERGTGIDLSEFLASAHEKVRQEELSVVLDVLDEPYVGRSK